METDSSQWYPEAGQETRYINEIQEISFTHKGKLFFSDMIKHWNRFPRGTVESTSLEIFQLNWTWAKESLSLEGISTGQSVLPPANRRINVEFKLGFSGLLYNQVLKSLKDRDFTASLFGQATSMLNYPHSDLIFLIPVQNITCLNLWPFLPLCSAVPLGIDSSFIFSLTYSQVLYGR